MGWLRDHSLAVSMGVFLVSSIVLALVIGYIGIIVGVAFISGGLTVNFMLGLAPYLSVLAILLILTAVSGLSIGWTVLRRLSLPRGGRLHYVLERLEGRNSALDTLGLSTFVAPPEQSDEDKLDVLKQRYVEGDINEAQFERELDRLNTTGSSDSNPSYRVMESQTTERER